MANPTNQEGSGFFIILAALASLGLTFIFSQDSARRSRQSVVEAKKSRASEEKNIGAMSAIAHYKSLIRSRKEGRRWVAPLYAENYFAAKWQLKSAFEGAKFTQLDPVSTLIELRAPFVDDKRLGSLMAASSSPAMEDYSVVLLSPNFDADERLVESVDIEVSRRSKGKGGETPSFILARIPLPPPTPYDPKLLYRKRGEKWEPLTQNADLTDGPYEFIASVSGIAFDADLLINGAPVSDRALFGGRDAQGRVLHSAVNFQNIGGHMGPAFFYDPAPEDVSVKDPKSPPVPKGEGGGRGSVSSDGTSCGFVKGSYGSDGTAKTPARPIPEPPALSLPLTQTFQLIVRGPDGEVLDSGKTEVFKVRVRKPAAVAQEMGEGGGRRLTVDDYKNRCTAECPYIGDSPTGSDIGGYAGFKGEGPVSAMRTFIEAQENWGITTKKICFKFPGAPRLGYSQQDSEVWAYDLNTCKGEKLFKRGACGCLTGDAKILLGDGKTEKRIDEMNEWDRVWNPIVKKSFSVRRYTAGPEHLPLIRIEVGGTQIQATHDHPFMTKSGVKVAGDLSEQDTLQLRGGEWARIDRLSKIEMYEEAPTVWNLEVEAPDDDFDQHYIIANGIVTGDLLIQTKMRNQK